MRYEPLSDDPDLIQAIEDFSDRVLAVRDLSGQALSSEPDSAQRIECERVIREHMAVFDLRAGRIGLNGPALFQVVNAAVDARARRGRPEPSRITSRTLLTDIANAQARLSTARAALVAAQAEASAAEKHLAACELAARAWGIEGLHA